jgi:hypothetical protein
MSTAKKIGNTTSAKRVAAYRHRMRARGLVPRTVWVKDVNDPKFVEDYDRQCKAIAANKAEEDDVMAFIEALQADLDLGGIPEYRLPDDKT